MPPWTRPVLSALATIVGDAIATPMTSATAAVIAPARGLRPANQRSPSSSMPWSTRTAPTPPSTETAAVVTIR